MKEIWGTEVIDVTFCLFLDQPKVIPDWGVLFCGKVSLLFISEVELKRGHNWRCENVWMFLRLGRYKALNFRLEISFYFFLSTTGRHSSDKTIGWFEEGGNFGRRHKHYEYYNFFQVLIIWPVMPVTIGRKTFSELVASDLARGVIWMSSQWSLGLLNYFRFKRPK